MVQDVKGCNGSNDSRGQMVKKIKWFEPSIGSMVCLVYQDDAANLNKQWLAEQNLGLAQLNHSLFHLINIKPFSSKNFRPMNNYSRAIHVVCWAWVAINSNL